MTHRETSPIPLQVDTQGLGPPVLLLHGGGGPRTVAPLVALLAPQARVFTPTLPGWQGTERPESLASIGDYADALLTYLRDAGLRNVAVIGSSFGGWIGSEMAVRDGQDGTGTIGRLVLLDAVGIEVPGEPVVDFFSLDPRGVAEHAFHDSERFYVDPASVPPEQAATQRANLETMAAVAGQMVDPELRDKLAQVSIPVLAIYGESDRIVTPAYGRAYAESFANGRFALVPEAGHLPQLEQPETTFELLTAFLEP